MPPPFEADLEGLSLPRGDLPSSALHQFRDHCEGWYGFSGVRKILAFTGIPTDSRMLV